MNNEMIELPIVTSVSNCDPRREFGVLDDEEVLKSYWGDEPRNLDIIAEISLINKDYISLLMPSTTSNMCEITIHGRRSLILKGYDKLRAMLVKE